MSHINNRKKRAKKSVNNNNFSQQCNVYNWSTYFWNIYIKIYNVEKKKKNTWKLRHKTNLSSLEVTSSAMLSLYLTTSNMFTSLYTYYVSSLEMFWPPLSLYLAITCYILEVMWERLYLTMMFFGVGFSDFCLRKISKTSRG